MNAEDCATRRPCYAVVGRDRRTGEIVEKAVRMWQTDRPFPSIGMANACRDQKAAMTGPRITWTTEEVPAP